MANELTTHQVYMGLSFRPLVMPDGSVRRVGVQVASPACLDPECYPNLLMAAPLMYQVLTHMKAHVQRTAALVETIESVLAFAQDGYLGGVQLDAILQGIRK